MWGETRMVLQCDRAKAPPPHLSCSHLWFSLKPTPLSSSLHLYHEKSCGKVLNPVLEIWAQNVLAKTTCFWILFKGLLVLFPPPTASWDQVILFSFL